MPEVVGLLHPQPKIGTVAAVFAEPQGHLRCYSRAAGKNAVQGRPGDVQGLGDIGYAHVERGQDILAQYGPRMRRASVRAALDDVVGHGFETSLEGCWAPTYALD